MCTWVRIFYSPALSEFPFKLVWSGRVSSRCHPSSLFISLPPSLSLLASLPFSICLYSPSQAEELKHMRKLNRHPNSLSYTKQFKWYSLERWQVLMRLPGGEHSFSAFADSVSCSPMRDAHRHTITENTERREREKRKKTHIPQHRGLVSKRLPPPSHPIPSLEHKHKIHFPRPLSEWVSVWLFVFCALSKHLTFLLTD